MRQNYSYIRTRIVREKILASLVRYEVISQISKDCSFIRLKRLILLNTLEKISRDIDIIKIDIEGYEIQLLNHLLDSDSLVNVNGYMLKPTKRIFRSSRKLQKG